VLYAEDQDDQWDPASLTKIMTAYVVVEALRDGPLILETTITCSQLAACNRRRGVVWLPVRKCLKRSAMPDGAKERCELHVIITVITTNCRPGPPSLFGSALGSKRHPRRFRWSWSACHDSMPGSVTQRQVVWEEMTAWLV